MNPTFLAIISLLAAAFAFWTKQPKNGLGFLMLTGAFLLFIPNLVTGFWDQFLQASGLVLYIFAAVVVVGKKLSVKVEPEQQTKEEK